LKKALESSASFARVAVEPRKYRRKQPLGKDTPPGLFSSCGIAGNGRQ